MRTAVLLRIALAGAVMLAGCGPNSPSEAGSQPPVDASIGADDIAFDRDTLSVPAGRAFVLGFENRESAPHNVAILDGSGAVVFAGEVFGGPDSRRYRVPAMSAGAYTFICEVHPDMAGELVAG